MSQQRVHRFLELRVARNLFEQQNILRREVRIIRRIKCDHFAIARGSSNEGDLGNSRKCLGVQWHRQAVFHLQEIRDRHAATQCSQGEPSSVALPLTTSIRHDSVS